MTQFFPNSTPNLTRDKVEEILAKHGLDPSTEVCVVLIEAYYLNTMGKPGQNDIGIYDDAAFIIGPDVFMKFNANTDPSRRRRAMADLDPGVWLYKLGIHGLSKPKHKQYEALVQAADVTVTRYEMGKDTGKFGINIHRGGYRGTSSLGCQTIYPPQWLQFIANVKQQMKLCGQHTIRVVKV